jgi:hypothetical protein
LTFEVPFNYGNTGFENIPIWPQVGTDAPSFDHIDLPLALIGAKLAKTQSYYSGTDFLNYPFGFTPKDFPVIGSRGNAAVLQALSWFADTPGVLLNLFTIFSYCAVFGAAWFVLRQLLDSQFLIYLGTLVITFLPMHFATEQNFTANYSSLILGIGLIAFLLRGDDVPLRLQVFVICLLAVFGFYWNLFVFVLALMFLVLCWLFAFDLQLKRLLPLVLASASSNVIMFLFDLAPSLSFWRQNGTVKALQRLPGFVDNWPFRLLDGLTAPNWSWAPRLFQRSFFVRGSNLPGEGIYTYGPYGLTAFAISLFLIRKFLQKGYVAEFVRQHEGWFLFAPAILLTPVVVGISGIAHLPGVLGLTTVKSWERYQMTSAVMCVLVLVLFIERGSALIQRSFVAIRLFATSSLVIGLVIALPIGAFWKTNVASARWFSAKTFFSELETLSPDGRVFWLPVELYPEGSTLGEAPPYHSIYGYVFTDSVRWTTAATRERYSRWQFDVIRLPADAFLNRLLDFGLTGLVIDHLSRPDLLPPGLLTLVTELKLRNLVLESRDERYSYIVLDSAIQSGLIKRSPRQGGILTDRELGVLDSLVIGPSNRW